MSQGQERKHGHYHKECPFDPIDFYRVALLFNITDPNIQHVVKKLLVLGGRGHKDAERDVQDSIDSLERWKEMRAEEAKPATSNPGWIVWTGGVRPVPKDQMVEVVLRNGTTLVGQAEHRHWSLQGAGSDIVQYRLI